MEQNKTTEFDGVKGADVQTKGEPVKSIMDGSKEPIVGNKRKESEEGDNGESTVLCTVIRNVKSTSQLLDTTALAGIPTMDMEYFNRPGAWDEKDLKSLLTKNREWARQQEALRPGFFSELSKGHAPKILWIGCSDARVPANEIIGEPPGSVFVHRNVANMVVNTDFNCLSVLQYAVDVLKVKHIIVCGHYQCGGIRAALEPIDHHSPLENWLRNIRDTYRLHKEELNAIKDPMSRQRKLVELNVMEQCLNLYKTSVVQKSRIDTHAQIGKPGSRITFAEPQIHALVYEPTTGLANKLKVNMQEYIDDLRHVYDLYQVGTDNIKNGAAAVNPRVDDIAKSTLMKDIAETDQEEQAEA